MLPPSPPKRPASRVRTEDKRRRRDVVPRDTELTADSFDTSHPGGSDTGLPRRLRSSDKSDDPNSGFEQVKEKENLAELILVWPRAGPGALKISLGHLHRLTPGVFLNDTIIEFGLQYWLRSLRSMHNSIAEDTHVFSSFFYKKLSQSMFGKGYQSVRTWTKNVDIFKKKYIIVPINEHQHWYLAIIYRPEFVLRPPRSKYDPPRLSTRTLAQRLQKGSAVHAKSAAGATQGGSSEGVERNSDDVPLPEADQALMDDTDEPIVRERSISLGSGMPPILDWDMHRATDSTEITASRTPPTLDYGVGGMENDQAEAQAKEASNPMKMPYIFTLDSLGGQHPQVIKNLQNYLAAEAEDKRKIPRDRTSVPDGKEADVPTQPNDCDCGLYLLHFAEKFIAEPEKFARAILGLTPRRKLRGKNVLWQNGQLPKKRKQLQDTILMLSAQWKETKAEEAEGARSTAQDRRLQGP